MTGALKSLGFASGSKGAAHGFRQRGGERRQPRRPQQQVIAAGLRRSGWLPPAFDGLQVRGPQRRLSSRLALAGESSAGLLVAFEAELADHGIQVAGQ